MPNKRVVVLGRADGPLRKLEPVLGRSSLQVHWVEAGPDAISACERVPPGLLLACLPLPDEPFEQFLGRLGKALPGRHRPTLAVLADGAQLRELLQSSDNNLVVMNAAQSSQQLQRELLRHLGVAARVAERFLVRLQVHLIEGELPRLCRTENVSETGMLVRTIDLFPVGTEVDFEISIPGQQDSVCGRAEIVRHANPQTEKVRGFGARFTSFEAEGHLVLKTYLSQRKA